MSYSKKFRGFIQAMMSNGGNSPLSTALRVRRGQQPQLMELLEVRQLLSGTAPTIDPITVNFINHSTPVSLTAAEFDGAYHDADDNPLASIVVTALPTNGTLTSGNQTLVAGDTVLAADLDTLTYTPNISFEGNDVFQWEASDGTLLSTAGNFTLGVTDNSAPVITNSAVNVLPSTIAGNTTFAFDTDDFSAHFTDADAGDTLQSITIVSPTTDGLLKFNGSLVTSNQVIPIANIGELTYTPTVGFHSADSFTWSASDGVTDLSLDRQSNTASFAINVGSLSISGTTVSGNSTILNTIASGDITPSALDSTDFGFNSTSSARPVVSRTFTITNNTANTISLTGTKAGFPVTVSGGNPSDFVISQPGVSSLAAGASTTFSITFKPSGTGLRKTTVSVASNITGETAYTFLIQGTGVSVTTKTGNLEIGTTVKGTGTAVAVTDDDLTINFAGVLENGTTLDPLDLNSNGLSTDAPIILGKSALVGINTGLAGMKVGETRVLFIPGALAFGPNDPNGPAVDGGPPTNGTLDVPADATVIYTVTATAISPPQLVVTGGPNSVPIAFGDKTPLVLDGTNLGNLTAVDTLTSTFHISDGGTGLLTFPLVGNAVTISGSNTSGFSITQPMLNPNQPTTDFTVSYTPPVGTPEGLKTATVTIHTSDPTHPSYTFNVQATFVTNVDLVPTLKTVTFPQTTILSGSGKGGVTLPVVITNTGTHPVPSGLTTQIQVWAQPTSGDSDTPVLVETYNSESVAGLAANGGTKTFNLAVNPPLGFVSGTYSLFAIINTNNSIPETDTDNDTTADTISTITVNEGHVDIQGNLVSTTLLPQLANGSADTGTVVISLNNVGNLNLPSNQQVTVAINLHNTTTDIDTLLKTITQSVGSLGNTAKTYSFSNITVPATLDNGTYDITATITPVVALATDNPSNNVLSTTAAGAPLQVTVAAPFFDVGGVLVSSKLTPATGVDTLPLGGSVSLTLRNTGNQKFSSTQQMQVELFARNVNDHTDDGTAISALDTVSVKNWAPNQSSTVSVTAKLLDGLPAGTYDIEAVIIPLGLFNQTTVADEHLQLTAAGQSLRYTSAAAVDDIAANTVKAPGLTVTHSAATTLSGSVSVTITNAGNVPLPANATVSIVVSAVDPNNAENTRVLGTITADVSTWKVNQSATFSKTMSTAGLGLVAGSYQIQAVATLSGGLDDVALDNTATAAGMMILT